MALKNETGISLPIAIWLASDDYSGPKNDPNEKVISATTLLKSVRQIVLIRRHNVGASDADYDVSQNINSKFGSAVHDSVEHTLTSKTKRDAALTALGYGKYVEQMLVNPTQEEIDDLTDKGIEPYIIWMELRNSKKVGDWTVSFQFDLIDDGQLSDIKTTSVFQYMSADNQEKYKKQGSIYRWGNPDLITEDTMKIEFFIKDWKKFQAGKPGYPKAQQCSLEYVLDDPKVVERDIKRKLRAIDRYTDKPEEEIPYCDDKELWRGEPVFKYYKNPAKTSGPSTKNFDTLSEAKLRFVKDGAVGIIVEHKPEPRACLYCPVAPHCSQYAAMVASGEIKK